jgi:hypothetical protein
VTASPAAPSVSIGVPVFDGEPHLAAALAALLAQTHGDFELIVRDNASTDGTEAIARAGAARLVIDHPEPEITWARAGTLPPSSGDKLRSCRIHTDEHAQHRAAQGVIEGQTVAQAVRHGEHPLADRNEGQHRLHEVRRLLRHAPAATARADRAGLAREGDEPLERALVAAHAAKTSAERPAPDDTRGR